MTNSKKACVLFAVSKSTQFASALSLNINEKVNVLTLIKYVGCSGPLLLN